MLKLVLEVPVLVFGLGSGSVMAALVGSEMIKITRQAVQHFIH